MLRKLKQQKGETLVETLAALLIATLSVMMLTSAITASARINAGNKEADKKLTEELQAAESYSSKISEMKQEIEFNFTNYADEKVEVFLYGKKGAEGESDGRMVTYQLAPQEVTP